MGEIPTHTGMVGPFWVVEENRKPVIIALTLALAQADPYGDMLTVGTGHLDHWTHLARRGARALREAGIPTVPIWSEYEEWPRGRVLHDTGTRQFIIRADRQLHRPPFVHLIARCFCIIAGEAEILSDDHYRSIRRLPLPGSGDGDDAR
jgi:hypothetical protein